MCIALQRAPPEWILKPERNDRVKPTVEVKPVHDKGVEHRQTQIKRYVKIEDEDAE